MQLPQVPACRSCNNEKSSLENYVGSAVLIGSKHPEGNRYRREKVAPRLAKNQKLRFALNIDAPPRWVMVNGVLQQMHVVKIDADQITRFLGMVVRGLYKHHYGKVLPPEMTPHIAMFRPENEAYMWSGVSAYFPPEALRITRDLGHGTFTYTCVQSPAHEGLTVWVLGLHGNIRLHGGDGSANHWWCVTRPTPEALAVASGELSKN